MPYMHFNSHNNRSPLPPDLFRDLGTNSHNPGNDPSDDPGQLPDPLDIWPALVDTPEAYAFKATVERVTETWTPFIFQNSRLEFDPGPASPDAAGAASSPPISRLASPAYSTLPWMGASDMSPAGPHPSPTSSAFSPGPPITPTSSSSAYSPEEYPSEPLHAYSPPNPPSITPYPMEYHSDPYQIPLDPSTFATCDPLFLEQNAAGPPPSARYIAPHYARNSGPRADALSLHLVPHIHKINNSPSTPSAAVEAFCPKCGQGFTRKSNMNVHLREVHDRDNFQRYHCPYPDCTSSYIRNSDLKKHMANPKKHPKPPDL